MVVGTGILLSVTLHVEALPGNTKTVSGSVLV